MRGYRKYGNGDSANSIELINASAKAREAHTEIRYLKMKVDKLTTITEALWLIIKEELELSDEELSERIKEIDLINGSIDGKSVRPSMVCEFCGKTLQSNKSKCIYCGKEADVDVFR